MTVEVSQPSLTLPQACLHPSLFFCSISPVGVFITIPQLGPCQMMSGLCAKPSGYILPSSDRRLVHMVSSENVDVL